jgi:type I restriction enzyme, S subunit
MTAKVVTKLEEIPDKWIIKSLSDVGEIIGGGTPDTTRDEYWQNGNIPWAVPTDITDLKNNYIERPERCITHKGLINSSAKMLPVGTILITSRATIGECAINTVPMTTNQGFQSLICSPENNNLFFLYAIKFNKSKLIRKSHGTTFLEINKNNIKTLKLIIPPIREQQKIASILLDIDKLIQKQDQIIEQTQRLKKGLLDRLLVKGIGHMKFKKTKSLEIPETWDVLTLGELRQKKMIYEIQDGNHGGLYPRRKDFSSNGRIFLTANSITDDGNVNRQSSLRLPEEYCKKLRIGFAKPGDVLFTHNATVGRVAILHEELGDCILGTSVTYYRLNTDKMNRRYFAYSLQSPMFKKQLNQVMFQTTRSQVLISTQSKLSVTVPPKEEQEQIGGIISRVDELLQETKYEKLKVVILKKGMMQKLLSGKIRVKV